MTHLEETGQVRAIDRLRNPALTGLRRDFGTASVTSLSRILPLQRTQNLSGIIMPLSHFGGTGLRDGAAAVSHPRVAMPAAPLLMAVWWYNHASRPFGFPPFRG